MGNSRKVTLGDIIESISDTSPIKKDKVVLVNTGDTYAGKVTNHKYIDNENLRGQFKKRFRRGDILYSEIRPANLRYAMVDFDSTDYLASTKLMVLRVKDPSVSLRYIYLLLRSSEMLTELQRLAESRSGTFPQITFSELARQEITLPSPLQQRTIAYIIDEIDDKIELNRQINEKLEAVAQALFKSWFVDFDPVRAKAEGRDTGLPEHISSLFPTSFVDSEPGQIPEGWRIAKLTDITEINPTRKVDKETEAPYLEMSDMPTKGAIPTRLKNRIPGSGARFINGDTLIARITPCLENGKTAYINCLNEDEVGWGSTEYIVLSAKEGTPKQWPYLLARNEKFRSYLIAQMTGTSGRQRVQPSSILSYPVIYPPRDSMILGIFNKIVEPIFIKLLLDSKQNIVLQGLRDTLLPRLISGELLIPDAERIVGRYL